MIFSHYYVRIEWPNHDRQVHSIQGPLIWIFIIFLGHSDLWAINYGHNL